MVTKIFRSGNSLALRLPKELGARVGEAKVEAVGNRWIVSPIDPAKWPRGFFKRIRLNEAFPIERPPQGSYRDVRL